MYACTGKDKGTITGKAEYNITGLEVEVPRIYRKSVYEGEKVAGRKHRRCYPRRYPGYSLMLQAESTPGP